VATGKHRGNSNLINRVGIHLIDLLKIDHPSGNPQFNLGYQVSDFWAAAIEISKSALHITESF
jgi:hypothetical protein